MEGSCDLWYIGVLTGPEIIPGPTQSEMTLELSGKQKKMRKIVSGIYNKDQECNSTWQI